MFKVGQKLTLLRIDDVLALTHRTELLLKVLLPEPHRCRGSNGKLPIGDYVARGKRKVYTLAARPDDILLEGWDLPVRADNEVCSQFSGNACYNLVGDPAKLRELIDNALLPVPDSVKAKILYYATPADAVNYQDGTPLYDLPTDHAVMRHIRSKLKNGTQAPA